MWKVEMTNPLSQLSLITPVLYFIIAKLQICGKKKQH